MLGTGELSIETGATTETVAVREVAVRQTRVQVRDLEVHRTLAQQVAAFLFPVNFVFFFLDEE